ncbi:MAG: S-adenosylmethionine:tRNA ribosyltransferase-isomerase, partial [Prevotella sp.]|nr:S-adenosylmethionine:tRNA ribosyltransferase-isomerase [Prevotella sp.]
MDTRHIKIDDYDYNLPEDIIAKYPLKERDLSKILIYNHGKIV